MKIRPFTDADLPALTAIWNDVVTDGIAFPQQETLTLDEARAFFNAQTRTAAAVDGDTVVGLYILHPNNVGRCGHVANASFAVARAARGRGVGRALVSDALDALIPCGFRGLQFNAVVATNASAIHLYESLGFRRIGTIPNGFHTDDGYVDTCIYYRDAPDQP